MPRTCSFLLRRAVWGLTTDSALAFCRRRDYRGRFLQDHHDGLEVHASRFLGTVHVYLAPGWHWTASERIVENIAWTTITAAVGLAALAAGLTGMAFDENDLARAGLVGGCRFGLSKSARGRDRLDAFCTCGRAAVSAPALGCRPTIGCKLRLLRIRTSGR